MSIFSNYDSNNNFTINFSTLSGLNEYTKGNAISITLLDDERKIEISSRIIKDKPKIFISYDNLRNCEIIKNSNIFKITYNDNNEERNIEFEIVGATLGLDLFYAKLYKIINPNISTNVDNLKPSSPKKNILFFSVLLLLIILYVININNSSKDLSSTSSIPTDIELMSYAQSVLEDNLPNPTYSRATTDYLIVPPQNGTLRSKIEGEVTYNYLTEKFYMIIEFTDNTYKEFTLISLQVGDDLIYK